MRKPLFLLVAVLALPFFCSCAAPLGSPVFGMLVTIDVQGPVAMGDPNVGCDDFGTSEASVFLGVAFGDASIKTAMEMGRINKIHHVDCKSICFLGLYTKYETIVYGERSD